MAKSDAEVKDAILGYTLSYEVLNAEMGEYNLRFQEYIGRVSAHIGEDEDRVERICRSVIPMPKDGK
jgi:hypothetical protein